MMKRALWAALASATLLLACAGQERPPAPGPALFVVRDADSTLYLYGTIHVRRGGDPWGSASVEHALQASDEVWTELEISPDADAHTQSLALQYGLSPERKLSSRLNAEQNAQLTAALRQLGLPALALDSMQPWLAGLTLTLLPMTRAGYDPNAGVDRNIDAFSEAAGKHMRWFETPEEQLHFFADMPEAEQVAMLMEAVTDSGDSVESLDAMSAAWEAGDVATLDRLLNEEMRGQYPGLYELLIKRRNDAWVAVLTREMQGAGVDFVAVGAAHIIGADGLVAQMRARGLRVERVTQER